MCVVLSRSVRCTGDGTNKRRRSVSRRSSGGPADADARQRTQQLSELEARLADKINTGASQPLKTLEEFTKSQIDQLQLQNGRFLKQIFVLSFLHSGQHRP